MNVLIVEDDLVLKPVISRILRKIDPTVHIDWMTNVQDAEERLSEVRYSLVVSDLALPGTGSGMDIWQACQEKYFGTPFVMMSGLSVEVFLKMVGTGICPTFISKPVYIGEARQIFEGFLKLEGAPNA